MIGDYLDTLLTSKPETNNAPPSNENKSAFEFESTEILIEKDGSDIPPQMTSSLKIERNLLLGKLCFFHGKSAPMAA